MPALRWHSRGPKGAKAFLVLMCLERFISARGCIDTFNATWVVRVPALVRTPAAARQASDP